MPFFSFLGGLGWSPSVAPTPVSTLSTRLSLRPREHWPRPGPVGSVGLPSHRSGLACARTPRRYQTGANRPATQRQPGPRLQTMRHAGRPTRAKLRCWRRATATGSSLVPQMRGWVDGRMQWPVPQHRSVIEPPAAVWRKDAASAGHGPLLLSCFAFRVASSFRRGCALSICCGGALFASPLGEGGDPAVFRFPQRPPPRRTESACPRRPFSAVRERPGICPPAPRRGAVVVFWRGRLSWALQFIHHKHRTR